MDVSEPEEEVRLVPRSACLGPRSAYRPGGSGSTGRALSRLSPPQRKAPPPPPISLPKAPLAAPPGPGGPPRASVNMFSRKAGNRVEPEIKSWFENLLVLQTCRSLRAGSTGQMAVCLSARGVLVFLRRVCRGPPTVSRAREPCSAAPKLLVSSAALAASMCRMGTSPGVAAGLCRVESCVPVCSSRWRKGDPGGTGCSGALTQICRSFRCSWSQSTLRGRVEPRRAPAQRAGSGSCGAFCPPGPDPDPCTRVRTESRWAVWDLLISDPFPELLWL